MHQEPGLAIQNKLRVIAVVFQSTTVVGVEMAHGNSLDLIELERDSRCRRSLAKHLPHRVGAVDEEPIVIDPHREARGVVTGREGLAHAQRD
jgi:hypothetical protein